MIASERIDSVISILKGAPDFESATSGIQNLGLTRLQAEAVMSLRLDKLTSYDTKYLQDRIVCCEKLSIVLEGIHTVNENERDIPFYTAQLRKSPMFQLSLSSKELFHSNFLYWISQISPMMFQYVIVKLFKENGHSAQLGKWPENYVVKREYSNFDLCVLINSDTSETVWLVIENKVKSIPLLSQIKEYSDKSHNAYHLLLSLSTNFSNEEEIKKREFGIRTTIKN